MLIAYELKRPLAEVQQMDRDEMGWWLAFFKYKNELTRKASKKR